MSDPDPVYRRGYRVETRTRELTAAESALVALRVREYDAEVRKQGMSRPREAAIGAAISTGVAALGALRASPPLLFAGALTGALLGVLALLARRAAKRTIGVARGPWHAPDGGWRVRETTVVARSVVGAASGDEDYMLWLLFEIPGGDWFYVDPGCLPPEAPHLAHSTVEIARLISPGGDGPFLEVRVHGDPIPRLGAADDPDSYAAEIAAERTWAPGPGEGPDAWDASGVVAEASLPRWMRELVSR